MRNVCAAYTNAQCGLLTLVLPLTAIAQQPATPTDPNRPVAGYAMLMMILLLLIVILMFGWFLMRSLQRSRKRLGRKPSEATDATDVWAMHKLPKTDENPTEDKSNDDESKDDESKDDD